MSMFGTPAIDATLEDRVAQLEAQLAGLSGLVGSNADTAGAQIGLVSAARKSGDAVALDAVNAAIAAGDRRAIKLGDEIGAEVQVRAAQFLNMSERVEALRGVAVASSIEEATRIVLPYATRAELAATTALLAAGGVPYDDAAAGLAATSSGAKFIAYGPELGFATLYLHEGATARILRTLPSEEAMALARDAETLARGRQIAATYGRLQAQPERFVFGYQVHQEVLRRGKKAAIVDGTHALHGHRIIANQALPGAFTMARHGFMPTLLSREGVALAGFHYGQFYQLHPRKLDGLIIQGDHNKIDQLYQVLEGPEGTSFAERQLTYSQHGVSGYEVIRLPQPDRPGLIRISCRDQDEISRRHRSRYVHWHSTTALMPALPDRVIALLVLGQSNSIGAGSTSFTHPTVYGPQTIRTAMPVKFGAGTTENNRWNFRLMTFAGGTIPHQGTLDGDKPAADGSGWARDVPIDPARIASMVPMCEGLGKEGGDPLYGGWTRESPCSAMALHLNGPDGFNGSVYVASGSFGFGSTRLREIAYFDGQRKQAYLNLLLGLDRIVADAAARGLPVEAHIVIDQGETDATNATYDQELLTFLPIVQADFVQRTNQQATPQMFIAQTLRGWPSQYRVRDSTRLQMAAALASPDIHILPPAYWADFYSDIVHYKPIEEQRRWALAGEVIADWLIRGEDAALIATSAHWSGSTLTFSFNHPARWDLENIQISQAGFGLASRNANGSTPTVSRAEIDRVDPRVVRLIMTAPIAEDAQMFARAAYGNPDNPVLESIGWGGGPNGGGQRCALRRADWDRYSLIDGRPLPIFASIQELAAIKEI